MKMKAAFIVAGAGTALAAALRCVQMLFFFDDETGFVTDSGIFTYLYCGIVIAAGVACAVLCRRDRRTCGSMQRGRCWGAGITALLSALFLFHNALVLFLDAYSYARYGITYCIEPAHLASHMPFAVLSLLFGIAAVLVAVCWLRGRKLPGSIGAVWAVGAVWGLYYMVLTFMTYSAVATTQENLFTVGGGALMLLFLLSEGKLLAGTGGRKASQNVFVFGLPAIIFWLTYVISNSVLILFGRGYATEMPYVVQLVMLALSLHAASLLFSFRNPEFFVPFTHNTARSERKIAQKSPLNEENN